MQYTAEEGWGALCPKCDQKGECDSQNESSNNHNTVVYYFQFPKDMLEKAREYESLKANNIELQLELKNLKLENEKSLIELRNVNICFLIFISIE